MDGKLPANEIITIQEYDAPSEMRFVFITLLAVTALLLGSVTGYIYGSERMLSRSSLSEASYLLGAKIKSEGNHLVFNDIIPSGPSDLAGIVEGARIVAINDRIIPGYRETIRIIRETGSGQNLQIATEVGHSIQQHSVWLGLYGISPIPSTPTIPQNPVVQGNEARLGVYYQMLTENNALGISEGALIISVGDPIASAGARVGDVITHIGMIGINQRNSLEEVLNHYSANQTITIRLIRSGQNHTLRVRLAED